MKKLLQLISVAICAGLLLSSCSRLNDITVSKRHYRSGYTVDFGSPKKDVKSVQRNSKSVTTESTALNNMVADKEISNVNEATSNNVSLKNKNNSTAPSYILNHKEEKKVNKEVTSGNVYASNDNSAITDGVVSEELYTLNTLLTNAIIDNSDSSSETPMWLLIVLCILLPPLAVGLKFGIIDKFWISCLLTLLFWIPGVIYALIVVTRE